MQIQGISQGAILNIKGFGDILSKLNIGDKINAQILNMDGNQLTLKLPNGTNVVATTLVPLDINLGDFIDFAVKGKSEGQIVLETQKAQSEITKTNEVADKLVAIKLPPDERNVEIGKALTKQNIPINKDTIKNIVNILSKNEGLDIKKAAFVFANNIDKVEDGVEILKKLTDNQPQLGKLLNQLIESLAVPSNQKPILEIISNYKNMFAEQNIQKENVNISSIAKDFTGTNEQVKQLTESILIQLFNKDLIDNKVEFSNKQTTNIEKPISFENEQVAQKPMILADNNINTKIENAVDFIKKSVEKPINIEEFIKNIGNKELEQLLVKNPALKNQIQELFINKEDVKSFLLKYAQSLPSVIKEADIINPKEILNTVKKFLDMPSIKSGIVMKDIQLEEEFKQLAQKLSIVKEYITHNPVTNSETISGNISQISNNLNFMNNVNNLYTFYQLPVIINDKEVNVDLFFVKNNKNKKRIDPDNATMFISLNTSNLGIVESLISTTFKKINFNFRLEDEETVEYFKKGQTILENLIEDLEFTIGRISYAVAEQPINVVNFEEIAGDNKTVHNTLDVRV